MEPGIANTSRPCSAASLAVISDPLRRAASTTIVPRLMALWKQGPVRWRAERELAHQCAPTGNFMGEIAIAGGIYAIDAVAEKGNRRRTGGQRAAMRRCVDALGESADDAKTSRAQVPCELECVARAAAGGIAAANDRQRGQMQKLRVASDIELRRRSGNACQQFGIGVVPEPEEVVVLLL